MEVVEAIERFETRSTRLTNQAWIFFALFLLSLVAAAAAVVLAPNLTAGDIGNPTYAEKIATIKSEQDKIRARQSDLVKPDLDCQQTMVEALRKWHLPVDVPTASLRIMRGPTSGPDVVAKIESYFSDHPDVNSLNVSILVCHGEYGFSLSKQQLGDFRSTFPSKIIADQFDREKEIASLEARSRSLDLIEDQADLEKLEAEVGIIKSADRPPKNENDLFLRLLQTSVTRFGLLAVIGFFVGILVSLYRYNVRLAAFYTARADLLRLMGAGTTVAEFSLLAAALTPTLEFGKAPQPPIAQLTDLIKSAKDSGK